MTPRTLAKKIAQFALEKKAANVTILDLRKVTDMADFFVIGSADSDVQVKAIADHIAEETGKIGADVWHEEGLSQRQWVLMDFVDVVVHIFQREIRKYYSIEKLWGDAKVEVVADVPPAARPVRRKKVAAKK
ncbi:MAG TPA: ribosome silencing factor [Bacteroidota bacterium]|nr:ribosome silencing factor [Bacteroidota bacterium]